MQRRYTIATLITSLVLVIVAITTMGVSYAIWTSPDGTLGGEGGTSVTPGVTPDTNYIWAKYFNFEEIEVEGATSGVKYVEVTTFYTDGADSAGLNLGDVHIPDRFWTYMQDDKEIRINTQEEYDQAIRDGIVVTTYTTYRISNQIFADSTLKSLPITLHIPERVQDIQAGAFMGLQNLQAVYFYNTNPLSIGDYAFAGCENLLTISNVKGGTIKANLTAFIATGITDDKISYNAENGTIEIKKQA